MLAAAREINTNPSQDTVSNEGSEPGERLLLVLLEEDLGQYGLNTRLYFCQGSPDGNIQVCPIVSWQWSIVTTTEQ